MLNCPQGFWISKEVRVRKARETGRRQKELNHGQREQKEEGLGQNAAATSHEGFEGTWQAILKLVEEAEGLCGAPGTGLTWPGLPGHGSCG